MKLSGSSKRLALYQELTRTLKKADPDTTTETLFKTIMPTKRLFRADVYSPKLKAIFEVNGGQWSNGRHNRGGEGYERDLTKINLAQQNGFKVFQFTYQMMERGEHLEIIEILTKN